MLLPLFMLMTPMLLQVFVVTGTYNLALFRDVAYIHAVASVSSVTCVHALVFTHALVRVFCCCWLFCCWHCCIMNVAARCPCCCFFSCAHAGKVFQMVTFSIPNAEKVFCIPVMRSFTFPMPENSGP
jgi:hypothetical protein